MPEVTIVPYENKYRDTVRRCVYETGYGGKSADIYFEDPELFGDLNVSYYTDYEPGSAFIALAGGEPAGYLLGCLDTARFEKYYNKIIVPGIVSNALRFRYNMTPAIWRYLLRGVLILMRNESPGAPHDEYPAHLHINLFKEFRRTGTGGKLIAAYLAFLRERCVPGVHLITSSVHTESHSFYEKLGFTRLNETRVKLSPFKEIDGKDLYNITYVMKLT